MKPETHYGLRSLLPDNREPDYLHGVAVYEGIAVGDDVVFRTHRGEIVQFPRTAPSGAYMLAIEDWGGSAGDIFYTYTFEATLVCDQWLYIRRLDHSACN